MLEIIPGIVGNQALQVTEEGNGDDSVLPGLVC